jgi:hypothetical protein
VSYRVVLVVAEVQDWTTYWLVMVVDEGQTAVEEQQLRRSSKEGGRW